MKHLERSSRWTRVVVVALVAIGSPRIAQASCFFAADFGQMAPSCGESYCYVVSPGQHTAQTLAGSFWAFGSGSPALGVGNDSGSTPAGSWLHDEGGGLYIAGDWQANAGIDGCIAGQIAPGKPVEILVALVEDDGLPREAYFAVASARRVAGGYPEFDLTFVAGGGLGQNIQLVDIPRARVLSSYREGNHIVLQFGSPAFEEASAGIYGDGSVAAAELVKGYRIYTWVGTNSPPSNRTSDGWSVVTGLVPFGQNVFVTVPPMQGFEEPWYGYTLVFDGGFETDRVGRPVRVNMGMPCETPVLDDDGDHYWFWFEPECAPDPAMIDCNDGDPNVHPGAVETCNAVDDDCNGTIDNVSLPGSAGSLTLGKNAGTTRLGWSPLAVATGYDVVRGDLTTLRQTGGSFSAATQACTADDLADNHVDDPQDPNPGDGFWYLLRAGNCAGVGSYDDTDASQVAPRDSGIAASGEACP